MADNISKKGHFKYFHIDTAASFYLDKATSCLSPHLVTLINKTVNKILNSQHCWLSFKSSIKFSYNFSEKKAGIGMHQCTFPSKGSKNSWFNQSDTWGTFYSNCSYNPLLVFFLFWLTVPLFNLHTSTFTVFLPLHSRLPRLPCFPPHPCSFSFWAFQHLIFQQVQNDLPLLALQLKSPLSLFSLRFQTFSLQSDLTWNEEWCLFTGKASIFAVITMKEVGEWAELAQDINKFSYF